MSGWKFAGSSEIGTSHLKSDAPVCQDAHRCLYLEQADALLCVVSDGAGSALKAEQGSRLCCEAVVVQARSATAEELLSREFAHESLIAIRNLLLETSRRAELRLRDYACTLLVAIVAQDRAAFWQIGDGAICLRTDDSHDFLNVFWPTKGEYANVTNFVTDANATDIIEVECERIRVTDLALFSDGLERLALDFKLQKPHNPFLTPLFPYLHRLEAGHQLELEIQIANFLGSDRVNLSTDDDKTLVIASRRSV